MLRRFFSFRFRLGAAIFLVSFLATLIGLVFYYHLGSKLVWKQMSDRIHDYGKFGVILLSAEDIRYLEKLDLELHTTKTTTAGATLSALTDEEKQAILRMSSHQAVMQKLRRLRQASSRAAVFDSPLLAISLPDVEPQIRRVWLAGAQLHALAPFHLRVLASDEVQEIDRNGNGKIDPEEKIYQIGDIFNGTGEKALQKALSGELALTSGYRDQASSVFITGYTPVKNAAGIVIALLIIDFSVAGEFDALFRIKVIGYYIMVGVLLISIAVAYAVSKLLLRPLEEIQLAALRIGQRDFSVRIAVQSHDELADLAEAINLLAHELGEYATHIEKRIQSRTQEIAAILSALDQGVLTLDRNGIIQPEFSAATANIFGANELAGQLFTTLFTDENLGKAVAQYLEVFFRSGKDISPTMLERANPLQRITITNLRGEKKHLRFFFRPIFSPEGEIARLLVTIIDDTAEIQLQEKIAVAEADKHTEFESLIQLVRVPLPILEEFINQQKIFLQGGKNLLSQFPIAQAKIRDFASQTHALKGNALQLGFEELARVLHQLEEILVQFESGNDPAEWRQPLAEALKRCESLILSRTTLIERIHQLLGKEQAGTQQLMRQLRDFWRQQILRQAAENGVAVTVAVDFAPGTQRALQRLHSAIVQLVRNSLAHAADGGRTLHISLETRKDKRQTQLIYKDDGPGFPQLPDGETIALHELLQKGLTASRKPAGLLAGRGWGLDFVARQVTQLGGTVFVGRSGGMTIFQITLPDNYADTDR